MVSPAQILMSAQTVITTVPPMLTVTITLVDSAAHVTLVTLVTVKTVLISMNVQMDQTAVMITPLVSTLMVVTHAHVMLDTEVMVKHALT